MKSSDVHSAHLSTFDYSHFLVDWFFGGWIGPLTPVVERGKKIGLRISI